MSFSEALEELLRQLVVTKLKGSLSSWNRGFFVIMIGPVGVLCSDSVRKNSKRKKVCKMARGKKDLLEEIRKGTKDILPKEILAQED